MAGTEDLIDAVVTASYEQDGRMKLACADAFKLARQLDVELLEIAQICNRQKIKICKCQLGCFE